MDDWMLHIEDDRRVFERAVSKLGAALWAWRNNRGSHWDMRNATKEAGHLMDSVIRDSKGNSPERLDIPKKYVEKNKQLKAENARVRDENQKLREALRDAVANIGGWRDRAKQALAETEG